MTVTILKSREPIFKFYEIFKWANTGTFTKSRTKAKTMAPISTLPKIQNGSGSMSQPHLARVAAINTSATDDETSQRPGRGDDQIRPRARTA